MDNRETYGQSQQDFNTTIFLFLIDILVIFVLITIIFSVVSKNVERDLISRTSSIISPKIRREGKSVVNEKGF